MSLVSIIIPYYKKKKFIKNSILSALNQTYKKFEVIIVYDDKNKNDLIYIKKLLTLDKRIKLLINDKNIGAGFSRNKGIKHARGKFVAFLDADDLWHKNKLKIQIEFMKKNKFDITHTSYYEIKKNKAKINIASDYKDINILLRSCDIGLSTVIMRRKIINNKLIFPNLKTKEDFVLWLNILKSGINIYALKKPLTKWKNIENSLSSNTYQKIVDGFRVYYFHMNFNLLKSLIFLIILSCNYLFKKTK